MNKKKVKKKKAKSELSIVPKDKSKNNVDTNPSGQLLNSDLYRIYNGLHHCSQLKGRHFSFAVARNAKLIEKRKLELEKSLKSDPKYLKEIEDYNDKINNLSLKYKGVPTKEFKEEKEKLNSKYKKAIKAFTKIESEMLEEATDLKLYTVQLRFVPEDVTGGILADIIEIIEE